MDDIRKLENIIDVLESQAKQVTEYSGLLSAVNDARSSVKDALAGIEQSASVLQLSTDEVKTFVSENREHLIRVNESIAALDREQKSSANSQSDYLGRLSADLELLKGEHNTFAAENRDQLNRLNSQLTSIDSESKKFQLESNRTLVRLESAVLALDKSIQGIERSNMQISAAIAALDVVTPSLLKAGLAANQKHSHEGLESIKAIIHDISRRQTNTRKIGFVFLLVFIALNTALSIYTFSS
jgi:HPt (histidine-containing phosphotransfer) domain-containing protein